MRDGDQKYSSNDLYIKYKDIIISDNQYQMGNLNKLESASTHIDFNSDNLFILITQQKILFTKDLYDLYQNIDFFKIKIKITPKIII